MTFVWPLRPNWRGSYAVTYQFATDILITRSGREQRRALRDAPRQQIEFTVTAAQDRFRALMRTLATKQGPQLALAEHTRRTVSTAASGVGSNVVQVAAVLPWMTDGARIVLLDGDRAELRTIDSTAAGQITFAEVNTAAWPAGALVCQGRIARISPSLSVREITNLVADGKVSFDVEPGSETPRVPAAAALTWNGREVYVRSADWSRGVDAGFVRQVQEVDYGRGVVTTFLPVAFGSRTRTANYLGLNTASVDDLVDFFLRMKGRQGEFYAPTDTPEMQLDQDAGVGTTILWLTGTDLAEAYGGDPVYKAVSVLLRDGTRFFREVDLLEVSGGRSKMTLASGLPQSIAVDDVKAISWLPVCRLASDEMTVEWLTNSVAQTRLGFTTLEALPPESL